MTPSERRQLRRSLPALCLAAATAFGLAACTSGSGGSTSSNVVTVVHANAVSTIDPIHAEQAETDTIADLIYEPTVTYDVSKKIVGLLADSYKVSSDAKSVTLHMRPGVKFHDGSPVTTADVKFTIERDLAVGSGVAAFIGDYASSTVTDASTITINLKTPDASFVGLLSKVYIVNSKLVQKHLGSDHAQGWLHNNDAGSGPYTLGTSNTLDDVTLNRWSKYWNYDSKRPTSFRIQRVDQSSTEAADLRSGSADIALKLTSADAAGVGDKGDLRTAWITTGLSEYMFFNTRTGPTANVLVRRALQYVYDYSGGLQHVWDGKGSVLNGTLPPTLTCRPNNPPYTQNLAKAKALLAQAGQSHVHLTLRYQTALSQFTQEATLFQSNLKQIGINLSLVPITFPDYITSLVHPENIPEITLVGDVSRFPDAGIYLNYAYYSKSIGSNYTGFDNSQFDGLLDQARVSADPTKRCDLLRQAQEILYQQAPAINMYTYQQPVSYRKNLTGITYNPNANPFTLLTVRTS
jgi:peptide/nickel transport system substrate-binding protein